MNLVKAHEELFRRTPDECYASLNSLFEHCQQEKEQSQTSWHPPEEVRTVPGTANLALTAGDAEAGRLNEWSFGQLCRLAEVNKDTVNRLSPQTASTVLSETLPTGGKPLQVFAADGLVRSVHGVTYTRLYNADLLSTVIEWAPGFQPPQKGTNGGTGLYCGEQDMFAFLIDPTGWVEIGDQAFAPGFFVWNSEVGRRTVGIQSFWFQAVCANHIVWDVTEMNEFSRKHTSNVGDAIEGIREVLARLIETRDRRRDEFARVMCKAMETKLGEVPHEAVKALLDHGITRALAEEAVKIAGEQGGFTIYAVLDALTRMSQRQRFAGGRTELDSKASRLLALAA